MYQPADILEAAKTIRPFLPELLEQNATEMDRQLALLIARCQADERQENQIAELLASQDATREWMAAFLDADSLREATRGFNPLPGFAALGASKYVCPEGDYIWHHLDISDPIPLCPTHQLPLVPAENS
jgi:hypothetical protein